MSGPTRPGGAMGSSDGALKAAATRAGVGLLDYQDRINKGLLYCWRCCEWHPAGDFGIDRSRIRGRTGDCRRSRNAAARQRYEKKERARGKRRVAARNGDRRQARRRVNYLVETGLLPHPNNLPCSDCGQSLSDNGSSRHEYDHPNGYGPDSHEDIVALCARCHHRRHRGNED